MADKDDFSFDQEPGSPAHKPGEGPAGRAGEKTPAVPSRVLLLGLLLVVLGAAAYFYSAEMMAPEEVVVPAGVTKQLITPPPTPAPGGETAPNAETAPAAVVDQATVPQPVPKLAEKGVLQEVPAETPPAPAAAEAAAAAGQTPPAATASVAQAPEPKTAPKGAAGVTKPERGAYTLLAGAYISPDLLQSARGKIKSLGYQPRTQRDSKLVEMTRVRIGAFAPDVAQAKLAALKPLAPDAFTLPEGELVALYAASHFDPAAHRAFAERLRQAGVVFEEETAMRRLPLTELFFGEFNDRQTAEQVAAKARRAGLEIVVFKRP
jgi:hypothetical protein